jgi:radical SAM protein with 4Fe4S-binding SPASM domain
MCLICNPTEKIGDELSGDWWLDIARQACAEGMIFCMITGGEPILHRDFWQIYEGVRKMGVHMILNSNGTTITPEIADKLAKMRPMLMQISVYGSSPEAYERVTGSAAAFEKAKRGIELLIERGITLKLRTVLMRETAEDFENIIRLMMSFKVPYTYGNYIFMPLYENCNDPRSMRLSGKELAEYSKKIAEVEREYDEAHGKPDSSITAGTSETSTEQKKENKLLDTPEYEKLRRQIWERKKDSGFRCRGGSTFFSVTHDGFIRPCEVAGHPTFDLKKTSFREGFDTLIDAVAAIPKCPECEECPDLKKCAPCPPRHYAETGSYLKKADYVCEYVRNGVKLLE